MPKATEISHVSHALQGNTRWVATCSVRPAHQASTTRKRACTAENHAWPVLREPSREESGVPNAPPAPKGRSRPQGRGNAKSVPGVRTQRKARASASSALLVPTPREMGQDVMSAPLVCTRRRPVCCAARCAPKARKATSPKAPQGASKSRHPKPGRANQVHRANPGSPGVARGWFVTACTASATTNSADSRSLADPRPGAHEALAANPASSDATTNPAARASLVSLATPVKRACNAWLLSRSVDDRHLLLGFGTIHTKGLPWQKPPKAN